TLLIQCESDFDRDLPVGDGAVPNVAARFYDLEPTDVADRIAGPRDGGVDGVFDTLGGGAGQFDAFVDVVAHAVFLRLILRPTGHVRPAVLAAPARPASRKVRRATPVRAATPAGRCG